MVTAPARGIYQVGKEGEDGDRPPALDKGASGGEETLVKDQTAKLTAQKVRYKNVLLASFSARRIYILTRVANETCVCSL